jgi:hypothetical protein
MRQPDGMPFSELALGDYAKCTGSYQGWWHFRTPNGIGFVVRWPGSAIHQLTEHEDGSVTLSPSVLASNGAGGLSYHGFLERGIWRSC